MSFITNQLTGTVTVSGNMLTSSNVYNLGSSTNTFGNLWLTSGSIHMASAVPGQPALTISNTSNILTLSQGGFAILNPTNSFNTFSVDPQGIAVLISTVVTQPTAAAFQIIGNPAGTFLPGVDNGNMLQIVGPDGGNARVLNDSFGNSTFSTFIGRHARGTAAVPTQTLAGDVIARFGGNPYALTTGFANLATAWVETIASENQTATTRGSNIQIWTTPIGGNVNALTASFDSRGIQLEAAVAVGSDLTVSGNINVQGYGISVGNITTYGNLLSYGNTVSQGNLISYGNTSILGSSQFSGNVTALRGIVFSDGSNITTAGVSYVNVGAGLSTSAAGNNGINLTTSAILGIAGTAQQVTVNQTGGNVTLSLPQSIATNSNVRFGNVTVGNLLVTGNITSSTATNLNVANKIIYAGNGATSYGAIDGGGFVLGNSEVAQSMLWYQSKPGWRFNSDLYPLGNVYIGGLDADGGDLHAITAYVTGNLQIGQLANQQFANANLQVTGSAAATVQVTVQNLLSDPAASGDFVATADTGSDTVNYVDLGINSSTYNQIAYSAQRALDAYLYSSDSNLVISTANVIIPKQIVFTTGGIQTANVAGFIDGTGNWVLSPLGTDDGVNKLQVSGNARFTGNVSVGNLSVSGTLISTYNNSTQTNPIQPYITSLGALSSLNVSGSAGVQGSFNVIGTALAQNSITNASTFTQTLTVAGAATVNQLISNLSITTGTITGTGTTRVDRLIANTAIQSIGQITSDSIVNNVGLQTNTLNVIAAAQVNSLTTNLLTTTNTLNVVGQLITNSLVNNVGLQTQTLNVIAAAQVNSLTTNLLTTTNTLNVVGTVITNSIVNNTGIQSNTLNVIAAAQVNSLTTNLLTASQTLNVQGLAIVNTLYSNATIQAGTSVSSPVINGNTSVTAPSINATTTLWGSAIYSNAAITAAGTLTAQSMVSNSSIYGQSMNLAGTVQAGSIISNATIQALGQVTVNSLISNNITTSGSLNVVGTAVVSSLTSNSTTQTAGTATVNALVSNVYAVFGQNVTINSSNASSSTTTGALVVRGGIGVAGDSHMGGNLHVGTDLNYTPANALFQYGGTQNSFLQMVTQNANTGNTASTDMVAVANNGNDSVNYIDMGITGSGYAQPAYGLTRGNDGYLIVAGNALATFGGNLVVATYTQRDIIFALNGGNVSNEVARFRSNTNTFVVTSGTVSSSYVTGAAVINGGVGIAGAVNTLGQIATTAGINVGATAIVNNLIANATVFGGNINTSGTATMQNLVVNAASSFGNLVIPGLITTTNLLTNLNITTSTLNTVGLSTLASLIVNVNMTTSSLVAGGLATVSSFISNNNSTTATLNVTGAALVSSLVSNTTIQSIGAVTVASLVSNANMTTATFNATGAAEVSSLIANTTIQTIGTTTTNALVSNVYGVFGQNVTVNSANASTSNSTGALVIKGGMGATGNVWVGNLYIAAGNAANPSLNFTSGTIATTPSAGGMEYDGLAFYATPMDSQRGVVQTPQYYVLDVSHNYTPGSSTPTSLFGVSPAVTANTRYVFNIYATVLHSTNNGTMNFSFGGNATVNQIYYQSSTTRGPLGTSTTTQDTVVSNVASSTTLFGTNANSGTVVSIAINGTVDIGNTGGTLTPLIGWNITPGLVTVGYLSSMNLYPVSTTTGNTAVGNWT